MIKEYLYPLWLRLWHWINALLFVILIITGISLHYSATSDLLISFESSMTIHNTAGIILILNYLLFLVSNIISGNYRHYKLQIKGLIPKLIIQTKFYLAGIFKNETHPYESTAREKFNPLQKITYIAIMFVLMPMISISGIFMLLPQLAPDEVFGMGGITPMAIIHLASAYFLTVFMVGHIYLATTGSSITANFKSMLNGYHIHEEHGLNKHTGEYSENETQKQEYIESQAQ